MSTEGQIAERARQAQLVLESAVYQQSWDDTRVAILTLIEKTPLSDTATAEDLRKCLKLLRDVRANLEATMKTGKLASFRMAQEKHNPQDKIAEYFKTGKWKGLFR